MKFYDVVGNEYEKPKDKDFDFRPSVYALVKNSEGKILLIKDRSSGRFELPGGGLDLGESFREGMIREVREETGYEVDLESENPFFTATNFSYFRSKDRFCQKIDMFFSCFLKTEVRGEQNFAEGEFIEEVSWFSLDEIKDLEVVDFQKEVFDRLDDFI